MRGLGVPPAAWQYFRMEETKPTSNPETVEALDPAAIESAAEKREANRRRRREKLEELRAEGFLYPIRLSSYLPNKHPGIYDEHGFHQFFEPYKQMCRCNGSPEPHVDLLVFGLLELIDARIDQALSEQAQTPGKAATGE